MTGTVTLAQLPVETTAPVGGVVHAYDPSQPVGLRDVGLTIGALAGNAPVQSVAMRTGNVVLSNTDIAGLGALATLSTAPVANGGTGATTAAAALTNLGAAATASPLSQFAATTSAQLASVLTDETGTGANVFGTSPTINTPTIVGGTVNNAAVGATMPASGAFTTLLATSTVTLPSGTTLNQPNIVGITSGAAAPAGSIGQIISSNVPAGSAVNLTTATPTTVTSIILTPGQWLVWGNIWTNPAGTTVQSNTIGSINTTAATFPIAPNNGAFVQIPAAITAGQAVGVPVGMIPFNVSSSVTVFLIAMSAFTTSTNAAYGFIGALRVH